MLNLVRALVTGGVSAELEAQFAEGREIRGVQETSEIATFRRRAKLTQAPLYEGPFKQFGVNKLFVNSPLLTLDSVIVSPLIHYLS